MMPPPIAPPPRPAPQSEKPEAKMAHILRNPSKVALLRVGDGYYHQYSCYYWQTAMTSGKSLGWWCLLAVFFSLCALKLEITLG